MPNVLSVFILHNYHVRGSALLGTECAVRFKIVLLLQAYPSIDVPLVAFNFNRCVVVRRATIAVGLIDGAVAPSLRPRETHSFINGSWCALDERRIPWLMDCSPC